MPFSEVLALAIESILVNKVRALLTMLGLIIGVGAVVLLVSIGQGAKNYISGQFEGLGTNLIIVQPGKTDKRIGMGPPAGSSKQKLTMSDVEAIQKNVRSIEGVTGTMFGPAVVSFLDRSNNINLMGGNEALFKIINVKVGEGRAYTIEEDIYARRVAVLGSAVAKSLFKEQSALGQMIKINDREHRVIGVLNKSGQNLGINIDDMVIVPTRDAQKLFNEEKLFGIRCKATSRAAIDDAIKEIKQVLIQKHNGEEDFTIVTQLTMLQTMNTILGMLTLALAGIAMISMLVGGIGIMNIMLVSVTERTREIGIRRAVGARRQDIMTQFIAEAMMLSIGGGLIGLTGSVLLTYTIYAFIPQFDMRAPAWILIPAFAMSSLTGIIFGVWPARKAAMTPTIEALRFE